jgi:3-hydroxyacyl-[acyl-carrier-protein] dehydratase
MSVSAFSLPAEHPCLPGHFPGRPLVPGVVLLDAVFQAVTAAGHGNVLRLRHAKFRAPVGPGVTMDIELQVTAPGRIAFRCHRDSVLALSGEVDVAILA